MSVDYSVYDYMIELEGVPIYSDFEITDFEAKGYLDLARTQLDDNIRSIEVRKTDDREFVDFRVLPKRYVPFERIRRITGYLVGTVDRWNDAKRAELDDRVKHQTGKAHNG